MATKFLQQLQQEETCRDGERVSDVGIGLELQHHLNCIEGHVRSIEHMLDV